MSFRCHALSTSKVCLQATADLQEVAQRLIALLKTKQLSEQLEDRAALAVCSILQHLPQTAVRQMLGSIADSLHGPLCTPAAMLIRKCCSAGKSFSR